MITSKGLMKGIRILAFLILITLISFYILFPFYWTVISSLKSEAQLQMTPATLLPRDPKSFSFSISWQNYSAVLSNPSFLTGLLNSTMVAFSTTFLALLTGSFAGFALGKLRFKGKRLSLYLILSIGPFFKYLIMKRIINYGK